MTYLNFLVFFLVIPIALLGLLTWRDHAAGRKLSADWHPESQWLVLLILIIVAVVYTTPWDNYLVATHVWWYDPTRVIGLVIGWVPIEEYIFFILQPILAGLWILFLARRLPSPTSTSTAMPRLLA